jgi:hypothetical protein
LQSNPRSRVKLRGVFNSLYLSRTIDKLIVQCKQDIDRLSRHSGRELEKGVQEMVKLSPGVAVLD